ncbi:MAG: hypothetical protein ABIH83_04525 [Candidatus Micrarchaeota archaeon]
MLEHILLAKILTSILVVAALSIIAEYASPKTAGILSGYPTATAIVLFFYGVEIGPEFASQSSVYNLAGLFAMQVFFYIYYKSSLFFKKFGIVLSALASVSGYLLAVYALHFIKFDLAGAFAVAVFSSVLFFLLFRKIRNEDIGKRVKLTPEVLLARAFVAAAIILIVTHAARSLGSTWAGLLSAFPATVFPLIIIVHATYGAKFAHTIIKNFPAGIGSLMAYSVLVWAAYPYLGVYVGTLAAFAAATAYLLVYKIFSEKV